MLRIRREEREKIDFYICHSPYGKKDKLDLIHKLRARNKRNIFKKRGHAVVFDHGWLYKSLVVDRQLLFGDSYYRKSLKKRIQKSFKRDEAEAYRSGLLQQKLSKRLQPAIDPIPDRPFIFVPGQVLKDVSIVHYSQTGLLELVEQVIQFGKNIGVDVVFKPHPGMTDDPNHGRKEIFDFCEKAVNTHSHFHVVNNSIFDLMNASIFTACVNSGSIVDNYITQTPVYCCGDSLFANTDGVLYEPDVERGLHRIYKKDYNDERRKDHQLKTLWWLRQNLIQEEYSVEKNISLLSKHAGVRL